MPSAKRIAGSTEDTDSPSSKKSRHDGRRESKDSKRDKEKEEARRNERNETKEKERVRESDRRKSKDDDRENKRDEKRDKESKKEMKETTPKKEHRKESKDSKDSNDSNDYREHRDRKEREKRDTKNDDVKSEMIGPPLPEPPKKIAHESEKDHKKSTTTRSSRDESEAKSDLRRRISDPVSSSKARSPTDASKTFVSNDSKSSEKKSEKVDDAKKVEKSDAKKSSTSDSSSSKKITLETKSSLTETTKAKPELEVKKNVSEPASTSESKEGSEAPKSADSKKDSEASKSVDLKKESVQAKTTSNSKKTVEPVKGSELKKETTQSSISSKASPDPKKPTLSSNATNLIKKQIEGPRLNKASDTKRGVIQGPKVNAAQEAKKTVEPVVASRRVIPTVRKPIVEAQKKPIIETKHKTAEEFYAADDEAAKRIGSEALLATFLKDSTQLKEMIKASVDSNDEKMPITLLPVFAHLRRTMRLMGFHNRQMKEGVAATLKTVEHKFLGFQNARSEIQHLQKDIARCLEFRSADEDIDLDPIEDFYKDAPESISKPEITKENEHELHLSRLNWEMQQRSQLTETLTELEGRRDVLLSTIKGKEKRLQSMAPRLKDVSKTFAPIREICGNWPGVSKTDEGSSPTSKIEGPEEAMEP